MGLVDYSDDESPTSSPLNNLTTRIKSQGLESKQNTFIDKNPSDSYTSSAQPAQLELKTSTEGLTPHQNSSQTDPQNSTPSHFQTKTAEGNEYPNSEAVVEPKPQSKLTFEEIRTKRLQLLMPEAWPGYPSWELPPEPETEVNPELQAKVAGLQAILERGIQFNQRLQANQSFRNPHIYDKLVEFLDLDEFGTNFPKAWYDPYAFPSSVRGSRLTEAQKAAAKAKAAAQAANPRSSLTFVSAQAPSEIASSAIKRVMSSVENSAPLTKYPEARRRKTKWDLPPSAS